MVGWLLWLAGLMAAVLLAAGLANHLPVWAARPLAVAIKLGLLALRRRCSRRGRCWLCATRLLLLQLQLLGCIRALAALDHGQLCCGGLCCLRLWLCCLCPSLALGGRLPLLLLALLVRTLLLGRRCRGLALQQLRQQLLLQAGRYSAQ